MNEKEKQIFKELLTNKMVEMFGMTKEEAVKTVESSVIQKMICEEPEYVDVTPLECWADEVYKEMIGKVGSVGEKN